MEIILSDQCQSLTGSLGQGFGYSIQKQRGKFVSKRNSKGKIPRDGHLRFIFACAELAQMKLHITDICVSRDEFQSALSEAGLTFSDARYIRHELSADNVLTLKEKFHL